MSILLILLLISSKIFIKPWHISGYAFILVSSTIDIAATTDYGVRMKKKEATCNHIRSIEYESSFDYMKFWFIHWSISCRLDGIYNRTSRIVILTNLFTVYFCGPVKEHNPFWPILRTRARAMRIPLCCTGTWYRYGGTSTGTPVWWYGISKETPVWRYGSIYIIKK